MKRLTLSLRDAPTPGNGGVDSRTAQILQEEEKMKKRISTIICTVIAFALLLTAFAALPASAADRTVGEATISTPAGNLVNLGGERSDTMLVGGVYKIGAYDVSLTHLGYYFCAGNTDVTINVYDAADGALVATATTDSSTGVADQILYAELEDPVTLTHGKEYYVLAVTAGAWKETVRVDSLTDFVKPAGRCFYDGAAFQIPERDIYNWVGVTMKVSYDNKNNVAYNERTLVKSSRIETANGAGIWNDFGSYIGMTMKVGNKDMIVSSVGRMMFEGNNQDHNLRIVDAETKQVLVTTTVSMAGKEVGKFAYADLPFAVTLKAGKTYYILSEEHAGGDMSGMGDYFYTEVSNGVAFDGDSPKIYGCFYIAPDYTEVPDTGLGRSYVGLDIRYGDSSATPPAATSDNAPSVLPLVVTAVLALSAVAVVGKKLRASNR